MVCFFTKCGPFRQDTTAKVSEVELVFPPVVPYAYLLRAGVSLGYGCSLCLCYRFVTSHLSKKTMLIGQNIFVSEILWGSDEGGVMECLIFKNNISFFFKKK